MALDKLVDSTQLDNNLTSVANAIRAKSGGTGQLAFPAGFVSEIGNISGGGGITPTGTKEITITENGTTTEDVTNYAAAQITVNVPSGGGVAFATGTLTFAERTPFNGYSLDVGIDCDFFALYATENPLQSNGRTYGGMFHDFTATTALNTINCTSNSGGSAYSGSLNAGGNISKSGTVLNFTTTDNSNFQAGITYKWYAWG